MSLIGDTKPKKSLKDLSGAKDKEKLTRAKKPEAQKLKHQTIMRFTDIELEKLSKKDLIADNGKIDSRLLKEFLLKRI